MNGSVLIFPVLVPLIFWGAYHYYHDRHRPEPVANLLICIALGVAASYLSRYMYLGLELLGLRYDAVELGTTNLLGLFAYAVLGIGLIEEFAKMLPFLIVVLRFRAFDEALDAIIYASFIALGYALVENLHYLQYLSRNEAIARGFAGPLVHIVFASVWAYHIGIAHVSGRNIVWVAVKWLAVGAFLHGCYDFIALGMPRAALVAAAILIVSIWIWRLSVIRRLNNPPPEN
jgi:RsiW-degrading membrane proteinase PrsW (M82 family)